jgi:hypothetical protein
MRRWSFLALVLAALAAPAGGAAQESLEAVCAQVPVGALGAHEACVAAGQAATSAQPVLGALIGGGNPTLGTAGAPGFRLGIIPRVTVGARANFVPVRLPDVLAQQVPGQLGALTRRFGVLAPALMGDAAIGITEGFNVAPGLGGIGGLSLLGSASVLPFRTFGVDGFDRERADIAWGIGGRLHLLRESFVAPGVSLSLMRRSLGAVGFGDVCPQGVQPFPVPGTAPPQEITVCVGPGDVGEFRFDLTDLSTRLVASKTLLGLGGTVGLGHDRFRSTIDFGFRGREAVPGTNVTPAFRSTDHELSVSRWTVFGNLSYSLLVATLGLEAGWQQGTPPITGFRDIGSEFDPRGGAWYTSLGARLSL